MAHNLRHKILILALGVMTMLSISFIVHASIPTDEQNEGDRSLHGETDRWQKITYENWWHNEQSKLAQQQIRFKKYGMRDTALKMSQQVAAFQDSSHADLMMETKGNTFDLNLNGQEEEFKKIVNEIYLSGYVDPSGEIKIITCRQPVWKVIENDTQSALNSHTRNLLVKVAHRARQSNIKDIGAFENMVKDLSESMLPGEMLKNLDARKITLEVMKKAGIVQIADGITCRPTVPQDYIYAEFANLDNDLTDETLFWSDPLIANGYHPIFGTAFNRTPYKGIKETDVDNVISRGLSEAVTKWNNIHSARQHINNPYKGCSSRMMTGLIVMGEQGRLTPYEDPTDAQLKEAERISKNLRMLPSQCLRKKTQRVSASVGDRVIAPLSNFKFIYPAKIIRVGIGSERTLDEQKQDAALANEGQENLSSKTYDITLGKIDAKVYDNNMKLDKKRLLEISRLKDENLRDRRYVNAIIKSYVQMEEEITAVSQGMEHNSQIPQITQLRQDIFKSIEEARWQLSQLHFRYDDLKQKEWEALRSILNSEREYIKKLMDQASVRYRTVTLDPDKVDSSSAGESSSSSSP